MKIQIARGKSLVEQAEVCLTGEAGGCAFVWLVTTGGAMWRSITVASASIMGKAKNLLTAPFTIS